jgi:HTH-type transcriptional regulator/antitoxin HigA
MEKKFGFRPDYAVPPGGTLKEALDEQGMSQSDLAVRTGLTEKTISQMINGIAPITYETSEKLEMATGIPAGFWNRREASYREALQRVEGTKKLQANVSWLKEIPLGILIERGYVQELVDRAAQVREVLRFFGVSSVEAWKALWLQPSVQYRGVGPQHKKPGYSAAWLRMGEIAAQNIQCEPFNAEEFKRVLRDIRALTRQPAAIWQDRLTRACAAAGVAVAFVKEIPGAHVSGLTRWLTKDKAIVQLSLKYKTDDHLWFTFFHEAGHILLHGKRSIFVEHPGRADTVEEREADQLARDMLIPPAYRVRLSLLRAKTAIHAFARELDISPGIVVGRLQYDDVLDPRFCNDLKIKLKWADEP